MTDIHSDTAAAYIRDLFAPEDRLAVVLVNKRAGSVVQRLASAERITQPEFQDWLRERNNAGCEVYVSMNTLRADAQGRTKEDIAVVRHVYLDFDHDGTAAVNSLLARKDLPAMTYLLNTSSDKWQVIWNVEGFRVEEAERLQRGLTRQTGADIAATDAARVLRIPGFYNHKYEEPFLVKAEKLSTRTHAPGNFPSFAAEELIPPGSREPRHHLSKGGRKESQSERDWAFAKRALARGEPKDLVIATIASYRRFDKHDPHYYAELTVTNAARALETGPDAAKPSILTVRELFRRRKTWVNTERTNQFYRWSRAITNALRRHARSTHDPQTSDHPQARRLSGTTLLVKLPSCGA